MIDRHTFRDHRFEAAKATCDRYSPERSYCVVPERQIVPSSVKIVLTGVAVITALVFFAPVIIRGVL